ncbi:DNA polymerase III subunit alpha [Candidatus Pantoea carbekii]|uniref:DNA polymerase III subunit alpha n=1 Tax=Candidatus Pantoea carbekii TaxID=1235990 RepID=UPI0006187798|nr:DNA polymerase III subunit alpha [Candidatus Pantoea carbekii]AKC31889.1 DNA polymerase III alpha subunit DnaE [Candidatus Pantoea carbekii]
MTEPRFIHLRVHSDYSMIDGLAKTSTLVKKTASLGMPAIAITDFMNLCGLVRFYNSAHLAGIKPIIGADFKMASTPMMDNELVQVTLLAANNIGYKHLKILISRSYQRGYGIVGPFIERDWLIELSNGLIVLSGGRQGDVGRSLLRGNKQSVLQCLDFYLKYFSNNYYLEVTRTGRPDEETYLNAAVNLAISKSLPIVATNEVCFLNKDDYAAHEIRVAIHDGYMLSDPKRPIRYSAQQYMRSEKEMCELFSDIPAALKNSVEIAKRCNATIRLGEYFLPQFPTGTVTTEDFLVIKSRKGLEKRLEFLFPNNEIRIQQRQKYDERLKAELDVINQMGFPGYFLIVMEFIQWSKDNDIPVGPGRGSGAGSLVAYALKITDLNPLEFDLIFERFLNPERISMPDFDIDFCMEKRDQVIDHVTEIYGREAVAQIITFGSMTAKAVIRDVGRVLGHPYGFINRISKMIPSDPGMTLEKAFSADPILLQTYNADEEVKALVDMARKLEGVIRNAGKHAGGVVISPTKITDFAPLYCDEDGNHPMTQFDKNDVEDTGLVKFDFLGLRTLTIIDYAVKMINLRLKKYDLKPLNISTISLNDQKSFEILQRAETTAVFQLESRGMKDLIKRLKPDCFEDIIALVALFRPGPLQSGMVDNFINRKHGREKIAYPDHRWQHESLKPVLQSTYGIILYQEQVIQIAQVLAGYTLGSADVLRRAMAKKKPNEMLKQRCIFREGAKKNDIDGVLSMKIFDLVEKFAGYGFNKSHSAAYALVSYQTLWLKSNYTAEFMAAAMSADMDNTTKIVALVDECYRIGLNVLKPDINSGLYHFHVNDEGKIVYGIGAIKGVGKSTIEAIIDARNQGGLFKDLFDLCIRTNIKKFNRRVLEILIISGACDALGAHRASLMNDVQIALKIADQRMQTKTIGQIDMFGILSNSPQEIKKSRIRPWSKEVQLRGERDTLGLYLTGHPIDQHLKEIQYYVNGTCLKDISKTEHGKITVVAGLVISARVICTKRGNRMGILTLDDRSGYIEIILFTEVFEKYKHLVERDRILIVHGQISLNDFNQSLKISAQKIMDIDEARKKYVHALAIFLNDSQIDEQFLKHFRKILEPYCSGNIPVHVYYQKKDAKAKLLFGTAWRISLNNSLLNELRLLVGSQQVELEFN